MAITHSTAVRNSLAGVIGTACAAGSAAQSKLNIRDASTLIVSFQLGNTPFGAASSGVITASAPPVATNAVADGSSVDNFLLLDRDGTTVLSGSVTATGMGGDIEVSNINIANNQDCELESLTYEAAP